MQPMKYFILQFWQYRLGMLTSGRHLCEWKQHLVKEAHVQFLYLATTIATKNLEQIQWGIKN